MKKLIILFLMLILCSPCWSTWDNTLPADTSDFDNAMGEIRDNWDALEAVFGVDLANPGTTFIDVTNAAYGAVGDGTTDDAAAIGLAITAATALTPNGAIYFPPGEYLIESSIAITSDLVMLGFGAAIISAADVDSPFSVNGDVDYIRVDGITFQEFGGNTFEADVITRTIGEFVFTKSVITASDSGIWLNCKVTNVIVSNSKFTSLASAGSIYGVGIGTNTYTDQDNMGKYIVSGNHFEDLISTGASAESHAVILYGRQCVITDNVIDTVSNGSGNGAEAIYTKCRFGTIANNTIINGTSTGQAAINIKGSNRGSTSSPQGFAMTVANNSLYATTGATDGINVETGDVLVTNNYLEGFGSNAICVGSVAGDNISLVGNMIREHRGAVAITTGLTGNTNCIIKDNCIYGLLASQATATEAWGILARISGTSTTAQDIWIDGNYVFDDDTSSATSSIRGIEVDCDATNTLSRVTITNNKVYINNADDTEYGIMVTNDGTFTTLFVSGNDCAAIPADTGYPFYWTGTITDFTIENNAFWGPTMALTTNTNIEWYHTGTKFTNRGAGANRTHTLPDAVIGLKYSFYATVDYDMIIEVDTGDQIRGTSAANDYLSLDTLGDSLTVECFVEGWWERVTSYGTLTEE